MTRLKTVFAMCLSLCACIVTGDAGALTAAGSSGSTSASSSSSSTTGASSSDAVSGAAKLDVDNLDLASEECASVTQTTAIEAPSDILIVVDRVMHPSLTDPTFVNFAQLIANDGIEDVRLAMLAGYPPDGACIDEPPLGIGECPANDNNPPFYRHVEEVIDAATLLDQVLDTYDAWSESFRPDARKHIFLIGSQDATLAADDFDASFVALDPAHAGYVFHAMAPGQSTGQCSGIIDGAPWSEADAYASLAASTGGVFENLCDYSVKVLFETLLSRVKEVALSCEYGIPTPPQGLIFDKGKVNVDYDDGFGVQTIGYVEDAADCSAFDNGWHYDDPVTPTKILMCPQTCARFEVLQEASIELRFGCATMPAS